MAIYEAIYKEKKKIIKSHVQKKKTLYKSLFKKKTILQDQCNET